MTVKFRTRNELITAPLEFEGQRAFAIIYEYGPKGSAEVVGKESIELDVAYLEKINPKLGADYLYKKEIEMPDPAKN